MTAAVSAVTGKQLGQQCVTQMQLLFHSLCKSAKMPHLLVEHVCCERLQVQQVEPCAELHAKEGVGNV